MKAVSLFTKKNSRFIFIFYIYSRIQFKNIFVDTENNDSSVKISENFHNSINDIIESVVNAARNQSEDSRDSISSSSETKSIGMKINFNF